jgi:hypothetical protein
MAGSAGPYKNRTRMENGRDSAISQICEERFASAHADLSYATWDNAKLQNLLDPLETLAVQLGIARAPYGLRTRSWLPPS